MSRPVAFGPHLHLHPELGGYIRTWPPMMYCTRELSILVLSITSSMLGRVSPLLRAVGSNVELNTRTHWTPSSHTMDTLSLLMSRCSSFSANIPQSKPAPDQWELVRVLQDLTSLLSCMSVPHGARGAPYERPPRTQPSGCHSHPHLRDFKHISTPRTSRDNAETEPDQGSQR